MKRLYLIFILLLLLPVVNAQPPFQTTTQTAGLQIAFPKVDYFKIGEDFKFHFHVSNVTTLLNHTSPVSCWFHLYNETNHLYKNQSLMVDSPRDFEVLVKGTNFSRYGHYYYITECNTSKETGFISIPIFVNAIGVEYTTPMSITYLFIFALILFIFAMFCYFAVILPYENQRGEAGNILNINYKKYGKLFFITMSYMTFIAMIYFAWNLSYAFLYFESLTNFLGMIYKFGFMSILPFLFIMFIFTIVKLYTDNKIYDALLRNLTIK